MASGYQLTSAETHCIGLSETFGWDTGLELKQLIGALLASAPGQAAALHRRTGNGLTLLEQMIGNKEEDMILALFEFGEMPIPADFPYMLEENVCPL